MSTPIEIITVLKNYTSGFHSVVPYNKEEDKLLLMDFTERNIDLTMDVLEDTSLFTKYVSDHIKKAEATYGIGGYNEHRTIYKRSELFSPSPTISSPLQDGAKDPSLWEGDSESENILEEETVGYRYADPLTYGLLKEYALQQRAVPTKAEEVLWQLLKTKQLQDYKFRRQHIIDRFIADFVCLKEKFVIEVDGLIHQVPANIISDQQRTERLNHLGFKVCRFTNEEIIHKTNETIDTILLGLNTQQEKRRNHHLSSPTGGQGAARRLHLGIDIWGPAGTPVYAPLEGTVHSFGFNDAFGDYGATLILQHELEGTIFYTLYGHLSLSSIEDKREGQSIEKGVWIAAFGEPAENGHWPPHLHFQLIGNMLEWTGDYPGVCAYTERKIYLDNSPDPDIILGMMNEALP